MGTKTHWLTMYYASFFFFESKLCVTISISASGGNILIVSSDCTCFLSWSTLRVHELEFLQTKINQEHSFHDTRLVQSKPPHTTPASTTQHCFLCCFYFTHKLICSSNKFRWTRWYIILFKYSSLQGTEIIYSQSQPIMLCVIFWVFDIFK